MRDGAANLIEISAAIHACERCERLRDHCVAIARQKRRAYGDWEYWGRPVSGFGDPAARLYILGLAPGAHGANRTGRMFTGDDSGVWLYRALFAAGFANQPTAQNRDDGLRLQEAFIGAVGRCAPPQNRLTAAELRNCAEFWQRELMVLSRVRIIVPLGRVAFDSLTRWLADLKAIPRRSFSTAFAHGAELPVPASTNAASPACIRQGPTILCSYHPSRQNTQTGRLTREMWDGIFVRARRLLDSIDEQQGPGAGT